MGPYFPYPVHIYIKIHIQIEKFSGSLPKRFTNMVKCEGRCCTLSSQRDVGKVVNLTGLKI